MTSIHLQVALGIASLITVEISAQKDSLMLHEQYRPQVHFTPKANWMNDPNGMLYYNNTYHLFYQYYPNATVWGPMHWGHATSKDLFHWEHQPIAIYPDSLGYIFSGSAVLDAKNTSGFGTFQNPPLIAIYTSHDAEGEKKNTTTFQTQSIAYSLDSGKTWVKYAGNPVLKNPGIRDFRDPKLSWHEPTQKWIMTLATQDRITFYSSKDLKTWTRESDFGKTLGAHGGVWECPDLFTLDIDGKQRYVLLISINPGGPNGGSATQYFVGDFDGNSFTQEDTTTRWIDYGPDDYAGVTWSNTGSRKIFLGWMSNWDYANVVPTKNWRSATTVPRELRLEKVNGKLVLASQPVDEIMALAGKSRSLLPGHKQAQLIDAGKPAIIKLVHTIAESFAITIQNSAGEKIIAGFSKKDNQYYIDRTNSGNTSFGKDFGKINVAPRISPSNQIEITLVLDNSSIELFADKGLTVMSSLFFTNGDYNSLHLTGNTKTPAIFTYTPLKSIYKK